MPVVFVYLLKLSISLGVVYLFYYFVLRKLTFYAWNRWYLLVYSFLSFFIASFDATPFVHNTLRYDGPMHHLPAIDFYDGDLSAGNSVAGFNHTNWSNWDWCLFIAIAGSIILSIRLIIQYVSFFNIRRKSELLLQNETKIYHVEADIIPFSFGNSIFINKHLHSLDELREIVRHEFVHVRQRHSIDILLSELLCIVCWYNPVAWLLKKAIRQNLEFIADNKVLESGTNKKDYQYLLLRVIGNNHFSIASKFNFSSLKKRIAMMNKMKSARVHIVKFLFILPLVAVLLIAFRNKEHTRSESRSQLNSVPQETTYSFVNINYSDTTPKAKSSRKQMDDRGIDNLEVTDKKAVIYLRNGKTEEYDITDSLQRQSFEAKYGKIISLTDETSPVVTAVSPTGQTVTLTQPSVTATTAPVAVTATGEAVIAESPIATVSGIGTPTIASTTAARPVVVIDDMSPAIAEDDVLAVITNKTTEAQLEDLKKQAKEKGYELKVDKTTYGNSGTLIHIDGKIKSADGQTANFSATDFERVILARVQQNSRFYFRVDVVDKKKQVI